MEQTLNCKQTNETEILLRTPRAFSVVYAYYSVNLYRYSLPLLNIRKTASEILDRDIFIPHFFIDTHVSLAIPSLQLRLTTSLFANLDSKLKTNTQSLSIIQSMIKFLNFRVNSFNEIRYRICECKPVDFTPTNQCRGCN
jgi:hypothetical protein